MSFERQIIEELLALVEQQKQMNAFLERIADALDMANGGLPPSCRPVPYIPKDSKEAADYVVRGHNR